MDISVLIPTRGRPGKLASCIEGLARQSLDPERFEVLVGVDGPDEGEGEAVRAAAGAGLAVGVSDGPPGGPARVRNRLLAAACGRLTLFLNDDVTPDPGLLATHLRAHEERGPAGGAAPAMIVGSADWVVHPDDTLFDRLVRETSMIFFYDQMDDEEPERDWGFRHAWTLNLSLPTGAAREVGGFCRSLPDPCYEDLEFAFRVRERFGSPVLFRPGARVVHDHRYTPAGYLERCRAAGRAAWALANAAPGCASAIFGCDVTAADELAYSAEYVRREAALAERLTPDFLALGRAAPGAPEAFGPDGALIVRLLYQQHLPLQRRQWRLGLLDAGREAAERRAGQGGVGALATPV